MMAIVKHFNIRPPVVLRHLILQMHRNYYFRACCQNSNIIFRFIDSGSLKESINLSVRQCLEAFVTVEIKYLPLSHIHSISLT